MVHYKKLKWNLWQSWWWKDYGVEGTSNFLSPYNGKFRWYSSGVEGSLDFMKGLRGVTSITYEFISKSSGKHLIFTRIYGKREGLDRGLLWRTLPRSSNLGIFRRLWETISTWFVLIQKILSSCFWGFRSWMRWFYFKYAIDWSSFDGWFIDIV